MYQEGEEIFYYLTLYNENYAMPAMPEGVRRRNFQGAIQVQTRDRTAKNTRPNFGSGPIMQSALARPGNSRERLRRLRRRLERDELQIAAQRCLEAERWNMLHPTETPRSNHISKHCSRKRRASFVAVSDNMKIVPDQIAPWVPGGLTTLRHRWLWSKRYSRTVAPLLRSGCRITVIATLYALAEKGEIKPEVVAKAIKGLGRRPEKSHSALVHA